MMITELIFIQGAIERGLIFALPVVAVYLSSRIIRFDDLTLEGSFGLGSMITTVCLLHHISWFIALPIAMATGGLCGIITGWLHTKLSINKLISGIITTTGAFSIALIATGSFQSIPRENTVFFLLPKSVLPLGNSVLLLVILIVTIMLTSRLLKTRFGFLLRALGENDQMLTTLGKNKDYYTIACLCFANMLTALSGSLFVQYTGYFSIWMQVGMLILALAGLMLSEPFWSSFGIGILIGPILYQALLTITFELQLNPAWNKLIIAVLMIILFGIQKVYQNQQPAKEL